MNHVQKPHQVLPGIPRGSGSVPETTTQLASDFKERRLEMKGKPYDMYQVNGNKHVKILLELT